MDKADIVARLGKILASHSSVDPTSIDAAKHLKHDLGFDSLDLAEMVYSIEEEFGITVDDDSTDSIQTVGDTIAYVEKALAAKSG